MVEFKPRLGFQASLLPLLTPHPGQVPNEGLGPPALRGFTPAGLGVTQEGQPKLGAHQVPQGFELATLATFSQLSAAWLRLSCLPQLCPVAGAVLAWCPSSDELSQQCLTPLD